jgi:hypothetical protein
MMKVNLALISLFLMLVPLAAAASDQPTLTVTESALGNWVFTEPISAAVTLTVPTEVDLDFSWVADATSYGGAIDGYRYGWDVVDPDDPNDPGWTTADFQPDLLSAPAHSFSGGEHTLHIVARDQAGATTMAAFLLSARCPVLTLNEPELGSLVFSYPTSRIHQVEVAAGELLEFSWVADATSYGGTIDGYRYGWDVGDPDDPGDPGWATDFQPNLLSAPAVSFAPSVHSFCVVARDAAGATTRGCVEITVQGGVPATRDSWGRIKAGYGR